MASKGISWKYERSFLKQGLQSLVGIDEAGRGPLAGPVVAAAVLLPLGARLPKNCYGFNDSKQLTAERREELFEEIQTVTPMIGIGIIDHEEIDKINILQATMKAMTIAVRRIEEQRQPDHLLIDGNYFRTDLPYPFTTIIDGDALCPSIAAASIVAKVTRDRIMCSLHELYPEYNFIQNKGYATVEHREAIKSVGYSPVHRLSFKIKEHLQEELFEE